jgi:AraC family transcriptional regulator, melibiose operon regulatory protein
MTKNSLYECRCSKPSYYPQVVAYYFRDWHNYKMADHMHDQVELMYVISGKCQVKVKNELLSLSKGDFILIDADVPHNLQVDEDMHCRMLNIEFVFQKDQNDSFSMSQLISNESCVKSLLSYKLPYFLLKDTEELYLLLKKLIMELDEVNTESKFMNRLYIYQMLISIGKLMQDKIKNENSTSSGYVKKVIRYMNDHHDIDLNITELASTVNLHPTYLQRIFRENTGKTLIEYLQSIRVNKAKMLLTYTDMSVTDITYNIGLNSRQYFSYIFKKQCGVSPENYRKTVDKFVNRL